MKYLFVLITAVTLIFATGCKKDKDTEEDNKDNGPKVNTVALNFSATWADNCGKYGKPVTEKLFNKYGNRLTLITCQLDGKIKDPMGNEDSKSLSNLMGARTVPSIYLMADAPATIVPYTTDINKSISDISSKIDVLNAKKPSCTFTATPSFNGNLFTIKTSTTFHKDLPGIDGSYQLAVYILEDNLNYLQNEDKSSKPDYHNHILRKSLTPVSGTVLSGGDIKNGEVINKTFNSSIVSGWNKKNLSVCLVVWRKYSENGFPKFYILNGQTFKM